MRLSGRDMKNGAVKILWSSRLFVFCLFLPFDCKVDFRPIKNPLVLMFLSKNNYGSKLLENKRMTSFFGAGEKKEESKSWKEGSKSSYAALKGTDIDRRNNTITLNHCITCLWGEIYKVNVEIMIHGWVTG